MDISRTDYTRALGDIRIRPYRPEDAERLHEAAVETHSALLEWLPSWYHEGYSLAESEDWVSSCRSDWEGENAYSFAIVDRADQDVFLGGCGLNHINRTHRLANLGYWVRRSRAGRGIASRAAILVAEFGLGEAGFERIEIVVQPRNVASIRVAEKTGARREALLRNRLWTGGRSHEAVMFSIVKSDLSPPTTTDRSRP